MVKCLCYHPVSENPRYAPMKSRARKVSAINLVSTENRRTESCMRWPFCFFFVAMLCLLHRLTNKALCKKLFFYNEFSCYRNAGKNYKKESYYIITSINTFCMLPPKRTGTQWRTKVILVVYIQYQG